MSRVMSYGAMTGLVVYRAEPTLNKQTKRWEVTKPEKYADFKELQAATKSYDSLTKAVQDIFGRMGK